MLMRAADGRPLGARPGYSFSSGEMGLYFRAEPWFATTGAGSLDGSEESGGATERSRGRGQLIAVPKGAKLSFVRGSGTTRRVGCEVRMGAGMVTV
jgi:hypothetical protein